MSVLKYGLGRLEAIDARDQKYALAPMEKSERVSRYWFDSYHFGNQKDTPRCVGYAWSHWLINLPTFQWVDPAGLYELAQYKDEWQGEDYDGTSVRAGAKCLHLLGFISAYHWISSVDLLVNTVLEMAPVVVGTVWFNDMFTPNEKGFIQPTGQVAGGHAYLINGVNKDKEIFRIKNSWGREWGKAGRAYISFEDMAYLLEDSTGEACVATEAYPLGEIR